MNGLWKKLSPNIVDLAVLAVVTALLFVGVKWSGILELDATTMESESEMRPCSPMPRSKPSRTPWKA